MSTSEQLELFDTHEAKPVPTAFQMMLDSVNGVMYRSQLNKVVPAAELARRANYPTVAADRITIDQMDQVIAAKKARYAELSVAPDAGVPPQYEQSPETINHLPTVGETPARAYDWAELAAGAHLEQD